MTRQQRFIDPLSPLVRVMKAQRARAADAVNSIFSFATITADNGSGGYQVLFDKETSPTIKFYQTLGDGAVVGDRVMMARVLGSWVILGVLSSGDTNWMDDTSNPGLITAYTPSATTVTSYRVRKIGRMVTFTCTLTAVTAVSATSQEFTILASLDPSIAADPSCDQPVGATGFHPQPSGEVSTVYLIRLKSPALSASDTYTLAGSYLCAG